jgi:hypothetical protein
MFSKSLLSIRALIAKLKIEKQEKIKDLCFEIYYTMRAHSHLNKIIKHYSRQPQRSYDTALMEIHKIGLYHPYADSINYLGTMKSVSSYHRE